MKYLPFSLDNIFVSEVCNFLSLRPFLLHGLGLRPVLVSYPCLPAFLLHCHFKSSSFFQKFFKFIFNKYALDSFGA
jgi:hypothetical protein